MIVRYLAREIFKSQLVSWFILLLIFFCQKLVKILSAVVCGELPKELILTILGFGITDILKLILPLSLFLAILITFGRLYIHNELIVIHACGVGKGVLIKAAMILAFFTAILAAINVVWLSPWSSRCKNTVIYNIKINPIITAIPAGRFQIFQNSHTVLFVENIKHNKFSKVFLVQFPIQENIQSAFILAESGYIEKSENASQVIILNKGYHFEVNKFLKNFRITNFSNFHALVHYQHKEKKPDPNNFDEADIMKLFSDNNPLIRAELHWRLIIVCSVFIMAIIAVPLSVINPRYGQILSMLPAMLLYLMFFLLESLMRSNVSKDKLDAIFWMWEIALFYLLIGLILNTSHTLPIRRIIVFLKSWYRRVNNSV
ncbi:permease [Candidatus Pantoea carbekii]|nr:permease [Candidatus Pantoea carbekii]